MKKQEVLDYMEIKELPDPVEESKEKCIALVLRNTGAKDYVICKNGGVVLDKKYRSGIARVIEYYPEVEKSPEAPASKAEAPNNDAKEKPTPKEESVLNPINTKTIPEQGKVSSEFNREDAILFLMKKKMKKGNLIKKTNDQLKALLNIYKK